MLIAFKPILKNYCKLWGVVAPLNINGFQKKKYRDIYLNVRNLFTIGSNGFDMVKQVFFNLNTSIKSIILKCRISVNFGPIFKKIGTVVIGKTRSLILVPIIMNSIVSLKNNLEFTFIWNKFCVHPLEMLRFLRNRTRMFICS